MSAERSGLPPRPPYMHHLPLDERGYPVPWFVAMVDGKPDFRVADSRKRDMAFREGRCWVCGRSMHGNRTYVVGPMCIVNRTTAEPPAHRACAEYSVRACPFLSKPAMVRRDNNLPAEAISPAGTMICRNPGVTVLWTSGQRELELFSDGRGGVLIHLPTPHEVSWWREGRPATREEAMAAIDSGLPALEAMASCKSELAELHGARENADRWLP